VKKIAGVALLLISINAKAGSCSANGNGNWATPGNWSCGHVPGTGDNVTIGTGITVTVNANNAADIGNLDIFGTLAFTNGSKIDLGSTSVVNIYSGGNITGGNGGAKLVFPSTSYSGSFSASGPFFFSNGGSGTGILPLTLVSFYSSFQNQDVILYWKTANEENINSFEIESDVTGNAGWQTIKTIPSMASDAGGYSYSFIVNQTRIEGNRYYRLKIVYKDGKFTYSEILFISPDQTEIISIKPTLVYNSMNVTLPASGQTRVSIYNTSGQLVKTLTTGIEVFNMDVSRLTRGEYFLRAYQAKNSYTAKFLKQ
jgi:Secretion system C-terminal sorting domain/G8 domain